MLRKVFIVISVLLMICSVSITGMYFLYKSGILQTKLQEKVLQKVGGSQIQFQQTEGDIEQDVLGFKKAKTYLILFLNNTELRPGGGFIGAYAVMQMDQGKPSLLKVEGTEILDNYSSREFESIPPEPLKKYLEIERWEFRDSNWSPDFAESSKKTLELYKKENGLKANDIDAVIGFTPTVIEEILRILGPVEVDGIVFNADNFTEKLEYEVEYGYETKGRSFDERKKILADLTSVLLKQMVKDIFFHWNDYLGLADRMIVEKQIMAYSDSDQISPLIRAKKMDGQMKTNWDGDYLLWVDANLGALKTDVAIKRKLFYTLTPDPNGDYIATVKMRFEHSGSFTWRVSRYRDYARVYMPLGTKFVSVEGSMDREKSSALGKVDQGVENDRQWFGTFIAIEPGQTKDLTWTFKVSPSIVEKINNRSYSLFVQKQLGSLDNGLTLRLDFDSNILLAYPEENNGPAGGKVYNFIGDLKEDRQFNISLE